MADGETLGMTQDCMAVCFSILTSIVLRVLVKNHNTPIFKANNQALIYILLISLTFCFLCSLLFIGHPNLVTCILQQITFGIVFTLAISTVLTKAMTLVKVFKVTSLGKRIKWLLLSGALNFIIPLCTLTQVAISLFWVTASFIDTDAHYEYGHILIVCYEGSFAASYCVLGYLGSLATASFSVALLDRILPDASSEPKFLTFSMLVFCSVWANFLPVYHSTKWKNVVAVKTFSILASSAGLLGCIFAPKCYLIMLRPERNSLHGFRYKTHTSRTKPTLHD